MSKVYQAIASRMAAIRNCAERGNLEWQEKHESALAELIEKHLPHGSGFDAGTTFDVESHIYGNPERLIFGADYHHLNANGFYTGWTRHAVIVSPSLVGGISLRVTGRDKNGIKDYIAETFNHCLMRESGE